MKRFLLVLFVLISTPAFAQKAVWFKTSALFPSGQDSAMVELSSGDRVWRSSTSQDTIVTKWIYMNDLNADFTFELRKINVAGTDTAQVGIEIFRGIGTPDSSGISRHQLVITNSDTTMTFHLSDSTWVQSRLFTKYRYFIRERAAQQNDYIFNENHYSPNGKADNGNLRSN